MRQSKRRSSRSATSARSASARKPAKRASAARGSSAVGKRVTRSAEQVVSSIKSAIVGKKRRKAA